MKIKLPTVARVIVPAGILALSGCSSEPKGGSSSLEPADQAQPQSSSTVTMRPGEPGGTIVKTHQETATVTTVNRATRELTLQAPDGTKTTVKCGPEVANFDQVEPGDRVRATLTDQLVIFVRKSGEALPPQNQTSTIALAPLGAKPAVVLADTVETTAKVVAINLPEHKATLQFPDGERKTFKVRDDVDLSQRNVGEEVVIRSTQAMALSVQKP